MTTAPSTLTKAQATSLASLYGAGSALTPGTPLSNLVPGYTALGQDQLADPTTGERIADPVRDQLISEGYLQWTGDPNARDSMLTIGPTWQAQVPATTLQQGQYGGPSEAFGAAPITGFTMTPSTQTGVGGQWSQTPTLTAPAPVSGLQQVVPGSGGAYNFQHENLFDKMGPGPIMSLLALPIAGPLAASLASGVGALGSAAFGAAGNAVLGGKTSPLSFLGPALQQLGLDPATIAAITTGVNWAKTGQAPNPISSGISLAQLLAGKGGA